MQTTQDSIVGDAALQQVCTAFQKAQCSTILPHIQIKPLHSTHPHHATLFLPAKHPIKQPQPHAAQLACPQMHKSQ